MPYPIFMILFFTKSTALSYYSVPVRSHRKASLSSEVCAQVYIPAPETTFIWKKNNHLDEQNFARNNI